MSSRTSWIILASAAGAIVLLVAASFTNAQTDTGPDLLPAAQSSYAPFAVAQADVPAPPTPGEDAQGPPGAEVLTQGPIHEAFAKPNGLNPQPGQMIKKRPPEPVQEIPPAQKPDGDNIVWINGYWAWDDDRNDFLWVSGLYRNAPPGQTWTPGYWQEVAGGFQWNPGFWVASEREEVQYLPQPPESLEQGPSTPAPSQNHFWVPGTWVYQNVNYAWQPGYWTVCRPDWIWVPAHYVWTPGGFVFIGGYWDFILAHRGCLFAPLYFPQPVYLQPAYVYTPQVLINVGTFDDCLFVRPAYCHYYFGDYFGPQYVGLGFRPWFSVGFNVGHVGIGIGYGYDPLFTYYRWSNTRRDPNWLAHRQEHFDLLRKNENLRPPHTFVAQQQLIQQNKAKNINITNTNITNNVTNNINNTNTTLASTITQVSKDPGKAGTDFKFHNVSQTERKELADKGRELQKVTLERSQIERKDVTGAPDGIGSTGGATTGEGGRDTGKGPALTTNKLKLPTAAASKTKLAGASQDQGSIASGGEGQGKGGDNQAKGGGAGRSGRFPGGNTVGQNALGQGQTGGQTGGQNRSGRVTGGTNLGQGALDQGQTGQPGHGALKLENDQQLDTRSRIDSSAKGQGKSGGQGAGQGTTNTPRSTGVFPGGAGSGGPTGPTINPGQGSGNPTIRSQQRLDSFQGGAGSGASGPGGNPNLGGAGPIIRSQPRLDGSQGGGQGGGGGGQGGRGQGAGGGGQGAGGGGQGAGGGQGGGGQGGGRGAGGGPPPGQQKDKGKDKDDKGKSSDNSPPRSNVVLRPSTGPDVRNFIASEPKSLDSAGDSGTTSRNDTASNPLPSQPNRRINDFAARQLPGVNPGPTAGSPLAQDNLPKSDTRERSIVPKTQQSGLPNQLAAPGGQPPAPQSSFLTKYDYQSMVDRGRSLSVGQAAANNAVADEGYDRVKTKDPIVSNPLGQGRTTGYGRTGSTTYGAPRGITGPTVPTASGIGAPSQSGITSQFTSGITAPSLSGITAPMASGITSQMASGLSGQMTSGISAPMKSGLSSLTSGGPRSAGSYISPSSVPNLAQPASGARVPDPLDRTYDPRK